MPIFGRATSLEVFSITDHFLEENELNWENCNGLCTDRAQSMSGRDAGLQALVRKKTPRIIWTYCLLRTQALAYGNMSEELQTLFK
jgi:hypothetical protein